MKTAQIIVLGLMFAIVFGAVFKALQLLRPDPLQRRLGAIGALGAALGEQPNESKWIEKALHVSERVAKLALPKNNWDRSALRVRLMNAGLRNGSASAFFFAAKTALALALPALALIAVAGRFEAGHSAVLMFVLLCASALGFYLPNAILARLIRHRQRALFEALPDALDLMTVCVEAGLGLDAAMIRVTEEIGAKSPALKEEFELMLLELRAGAGRDKALRNLALRTGVEDIDTLTGMLIQADRFGASIGASLRVYTDTLRTKRRMKAEEQAAKIALKLLFPLIFCIFPALFVILLGPALIHIYRVLLPSMAGVSS